MRWPFEIRTGSAVFSKIRLATGRTWLGDPGMLARARMLERRSLWRLCGDSFSTGSPRATYAESREPSRGSPARSKRRARRANRPRDLRRDAEPGLQLAPPPRGHFEHAAVQVLDDPLPPQRQLK